MKWYRNIMKDWTNIIIGMMRCTLYMNQVVIKLDTKTHNFCFWWFAMTKKITLEWVVDIKLTTISKILAHFDCNRKLCCTLNSSNYTWNYRTLILTWIRYYCHKTKEKFWRVWYFAFSWNYRYMLRLISSW